MPSSIRNSFRGGSSSKGWSLQAQLKKQGAINAPNPPLALFGQPVAANVKALMLPGGIGQQTKMALWSGGIAVMRTRAQAGLRDPGEHGLRRDLGQDDEPDVQDLAGRQDVGTSGQAVEHHQR